MEYLIMRKDQPLTMVDFSADGTMTGYSTRVVDRSLIPFGRINDPDWPRKWWNERAIPIGQGKISEMLKRKGLVSPQEYLVRNLGLSLTDYYWVKPIESFLKWKEVNLFENDFKDDAMNLEQVTSSEPGSFSPNSSLQGQLEKTWTIHEGKRVLVKGNHGNLSCESINEVLASKLHEMQGYENYAEYNLIRIKDKEYDFGCYSSLFTSQELELVSAHEIVSSEKKRNDVSYYEQFIAVCVENGMDEQSLRADLEYQILTDFILSNRDRHLGNIAVLRDAKSLKFIRLAPIFDTGQSMFVHDYIPLSERELLDIRVNSFAATESGLLKYVEDRSRVNADKLPDAAFVEQLYKKDSQMDENRIRLIVEAYERKKELFSRYQQGEDLNEIRWK